MRSDVRITTGSIINPKAFPRQSCCATWWNWSKMFACHRYRQYHINSLELISIVHSVEWRIKNLNELQLRIFHITDSYVCMSLISNGRSSSKMLKPLLSRLAATTCLGALYLAVVHVESSDNPTDHDSRT